MNIKLKNRKCLDCEHRYGQVAQHPVCDVCTQANNFPHYEKDKGIRITRLDVEHKLDNTEKDEQIYKLWKLLDDIDTGSDMYKCDYEGFAKYTYVKQQERFDIVDKKTVAKLYDDFYPSPSNIYRDEAHPRNEYETPVITPELPKSVLLGSNRYTVELVNNLQERPKYMKDNDLLGYIDYVEKEIYILTIDGDTGDRHEFDYLNNVLVHEMIHGYLDEIGLDHLNSEKKVQLMTRMFINLKNNF